MLVFSQTPVAFLSLKNYFWNVPGHLKSALLSFFLEKKILNHYSIYQSFISVCFIFMSKKFTFSFEHLAVNAIGGWIILTYSLKTLKDSSLARK